VQEACYQYQKTVLEALEETENAIASFHYELERNRQLSQAQDASQEARDLTFQLYQRGVKDYLEVLVTDRSYLSTQDAFIQSKVALLCHYIALYKALGGSCELTSYVIID
jgi:outer membrane protein TolC